MGITMPLAQRGPSCNGLLVGMHCTGVLFYFMRQSFPRVRVARALSLIAFSA